MEMKAIRFYEKDGDLSLLKGKKIAIIGYGSQGHAHALNLRDSGLDVIVGLPPTSKSKAKAEAAGLTVLSPADATKAGDVLMVLVPDHIQGDLYKSDIEPNLTPGKTLMFAHGFNIHFGAITAPAGVDVIEARITRLSYAPEIAQVMLQRQQAGAVVAARSRIVDGAVGMVQMALGRLSAENIVELDEERKAAMVSNLLVVLCGDRGTQPIVNAGSLYQ